MILADTGAMVALLDRNDRHHEAVSAIYRANPDGWVLPWAILPEVDYLVASEIGPHAQDVWLSDLASGAFAVEWAHDGDLEAAARINRRYKSLRLGLVDATVIALAERLKAEAIATLDLRHFGAVRIKGTPRLLPRDAQAGDRER
jgi:predicted nucleic acid-binding protein